LLALPRLIFLIHHLLLTELLFPGALEGTRNQSVFRLDLIVLSPGTLDIVARTLALELPLLIKQSRLRLEFSHRFDRDGYLVRGKRFQQDLLDLGIDRKCSDLLTSGAAIDVVIARAQIHGIGSLGPGVVKAHLSTAAAANSNSLQEGLTLAGGAGLSAPVARSVALEATLVSHELFPADVTRMGIL
jgi:hypothetical protein